MSNDINANDFLVDDEDVPFGGDHDPADMGPPAHGKQKGRSTPAKRAKARAANVVYGLGDRIDNVAAQHNELVAQQQESLSDMSRRTEDAISKENDSRLKQIRDQEERDHELKMEAMRQEGLIARLNASHPQNQQHQQETDPSGGIRVFDPNSKQFNYGHNLTIDQNGPRFW